MVEYAGQRTFDSEQSLVLMVTSHVDHDKAFGGAPPLAVRGVREISHGVFGVFGVFEVRFRLREASAVKAVALQPGRIARLLHAQILTLAHIECRKVVRQSGG
jgi:hypothetical protein